MRHLGAPLLRIRKLIQPTNYYVTTSTIPSRYYQDTLNTPSNFPLRPLSRTFLPDFRNHRITLRPCPVSTHRFRTSVVFPSILPNSAFLPLSFFLACFIAFLDNLANDAFATLTLVTGLAGPTALDRPFFNPGFVSLAPFPLFPCVLP